MNKKTILAGLMFILMINIAYSLEFYKGTVNVNSIDANLTIGEELEVAAEYTFIGNEKVNLDFFNFPEDAVVMYDGVNYGKKFDLEINGDAIVTVSYTEQLNEEDFKTASFNPNVYFNGNLNTKRINSTSINLDIPYKIISASNIPIEIVYGKRNNYLWKSNDVYASRLSFSWNTQDIDLLIKREYPNMDEFLEGAFTLTTTLTNKGNPIDNMVLVTSFMPSDFEVISPKKDFETIIDGNDVRVEWKKEIPYFDSGETLQFEYKLKINDAAASVVLRPLNAYVDGSLVAVTNKLEFFSEESIIEQNTRGDIADREFEKRNDIGRVLNKEPMEPTLRVPKIGENLDGKEVFIFEGKKYVYVEKSLLDATEAEGKKELPLLSIRSIVLIVLFLIISLIILYFKLFRKKPDHKIIKYIQLRLEEGYTQSQITEYLLKLNIDKKKIEECFVIAKKEMKYREMR
ncbi:hypothetical protein CMO93_01055 [Candidatus Woesearchaeota archaeon]|nr:hypothetical protein [Candidatus Woesearchaeota archaeon]|tara:strand:- start:30 stop:1406 length:1377 start_codon:yes stop_codon:yes gene_type:complete